MSSLTPTIFQESVGVVHGRGTLTNPSLAQLRDDDVYGARWAATELFHIDQGNPSPTKMSDVYSFACLMLQVRLPLFYLPRGMVSIRCSRCSQERCRTVAQTGPNKSCT